MRLYIIVASALSAGLKIAQACHALRAFVEAYPTEEGRWYSESNNLVVLEHRDIVEAADDLERRGLRIVRFREPDLADQLTAICVEPTQGARRILADYRLAAR